MNAPAPGRVIPDPDHSIPAFDTIYLVLMEWWSEMHQPHCGENARGFHWNIAARAFVQKEHAERELARLAANPMTRAVRLVTVPNEPCDLTTERTSQ
jgi:hypothetical protein